MKIGDAVNQLVELIDDNNRDIAAVQRGDHRHAYNCWAERGGTCDLCECICHKKTFRLDSIDVRVQNDRDIEWIVYARDKAGVPYDYAAYVSRDGQIVIDGTD